MNKNILIYLALLVIALWFFSNRESDKITSVTPTSSPPIQSVVIPSLVPVVEPTWTPYYVVPTIQPVEVILHPRQEQPNTGTTGSHDPGRSDSRHP